MRIPIAAKVFLGFLVVVFLNVFYVVVVFKLSALNNIAHILKKQDSVQQGFLRIQNLHQSRRRLRVIYNGLKNEESVENFRGISSTVSGLLDSLVAQLDSVRLLDSLVTRETTPDPRVARLIQNVRQGAQESNRRYASQLEQLVNAEKIDNPTLRLRKKREVNERIDEADSSFAQTLRNVTRMIDSQTKIRIKDIETRMRNAQQITLALLIGISAFVALFAFVFSRYITNSLRKLKESASYIGKGNFYFNPSGYPKDEIGDLAGAFFDMALDLKKTQEELVKSKRLAAIGEVVASVNHEINNPLMIISGNAQFLQMAMKDLPPEIQDRVHTILEETERISQVTRKLRELKKPIVEDYTSSGEQMINLDKSTGDN